MSKDTSQQTPTGHEIPVPKRRDVLADLRKVANADEPSGDDANEETDL